MNTDKYFASRRTIRKYDTTRDIHASAIMEMLEDAAHAPNTGNMQIYSVIITKDEDGKKALAPAHFNQPAVMNASAVLTFCIDLNRFSHWCRINDTTPGFNNLQGFTWGVIDASIFAQQFCTIHVITVTVGYPAENPEISDRLPIEAIAHLEKYHLADSAEIKNIYAEKEALPSSKQFITENSKDNLAQVYAEVRYPSEANEKFSQVYREFLKNQGIQI